MTKSQGVGLTQCRCVNPRTIGGRGKLRSLCSVALCVTNETFDRAESERIRLPGGTSKDLPHVAL
jgi:hypothetical protein